MALRISLGATRFRLMRQAITESLLLAGAGAGLGGPLPGQRAGGRRGVSLRRASAPRRIGKIQVRSALSQHADAAHCRAGGDGEVQRHGRAGRANSLRAEVHARSSSAVGHLRLRRCGQKQASQEKQRGDTRLQGRQFVGKKCNRMHLRNLALWNVVQLRAMSPGESGVLMLTGDSILPSTYLKAPILDGPTRNATQAWECP